MHVLLDGERADAAAAAVCVLGPVSVRAGGAAAVH